MDNVERAIWRKFRIKHRDTLPFKGWAGTRLTLAELFGELGFTRGAEIGVCEGIYSEVLYKAIPGLKLICVDPWVAYNRISQQMAEGRYKIALERLVPYGASIWKLTSMEAVQDVEDESLDFVYIDGLHEFDPVMLDLIHWVKKVRLGGIVAGHDYCHFYQGGVVAAVDAYTRAHGINQWYLTRDNEPSFFWIKR